MDVPVGEILVIIFPRHQHFMKHLLLVHLVASSHLLYHSVASRPQNALLLPCPKNLANL